MVLVGAVRLQINGEANGTLGFLVDFALKNIKKCIFVQPWLAFNSLYFHPQLVLLTIVLLAAFGNDEISLNQD
jgi:hypothetical protein